MKAISLEYLYEKYKECQEVSTDTRKIGKNSLFFALKGPNFDANGFAEEALSKGARYAVVDDPTRVTSPQILYVTDGLKALQSLANFHRKQLQIPVIGLTGSNGKTTTKELINSVLSVKYKTLATRGNLNNHIGVPLTLLAIDDSVEIAIIEMGANKQGDIRELVEIAEPTLGLITNIGKAHLEGFGGLEGVRKGKGELYDWLGSRGGWVLVNTQAEATVEMAQERNLQVIWVGSEGSFYQATMLEERPVVVFADEAGQVYQTHLPGAYNFHNMLMALAVGRYFEVPPQEACQAVANYQPDNNRSQFLEKNGNQLLLDSYNANPSSMAAAIVLFDKLKANKKMVILGDMFELGEDGPAEHTALGALVANCHFDYVLLAGDLMHHALVHLPKAYYFPDKFGLHLWLKDHPMTGLHVLIKGSRGMGLESVLQVL
jgi:UDP-N-acetylmuramoyl-tripeptide--D-alanyl-D-alanine ligase